MGSAKSNPAQIMYAFSDYSDAFKMGASFSKLSELRYEILIFDDFDDMDAFGALEALHWASYSVQLKSIRKVDFITSSAGLKIIPAGTFDLQNPPDVLILPGGGWLFSNQQSDGVCIGAALEVKRGEILELLRGFHKIAVEKQKVLASVCTGGLVLGSAGLLKDRPATTNRQAYDELTGMGAKLVKARVVDDGEIITAGGITASLDLGLWLIQRFGGPQKALEISEQLEFEMRGPIWQRS